MWPWKEKVISKVRSAYALTECRARINLSHPAPPSVEWKLNPGEMHRLIQEHVSVLGRVGCGKTRVLEVVRPEFESSFFHLIDMT